MKFPVVALLAAASSVVAQTAGFDAITSPLQNQVLTAGSSFKIVWEPNNVDGTITITLIQGAAFNLLNKGPVIASGVRNLDGEFVWDPVPAAQYAAYGFNITLDKDPSTYQLSNGFHISGAPSSTSKSETVAKTTTVSLAPGPSYSALLNTTTSTPTWVYSTKHNGTYTAPCNVTSAKPTTASYPATTVAVVTTPVTPVTSSAPTKTPTPSPVAGAAAHIATSGLAMVGGLILAFAL